MFKAVVFDIDNTLYDYDGLNNKAIEAAGKWFCEKEKFSFDEFKRAFEKGREATKKNMRDCAARHNRLIYFQRMSEELGLNPIQYSLELYEKYWGYMLENMRMFPEASQLINKLKKDGVKIGICTDLTSQIQHRKLRRMGIAELIDVFVSSEEADAEKPDEKIFNLIIEKLRISPGQVAYVGDSFMKDIVGAHNVGMFPVWYNQEEDICPAGYEIEMKMVKNFKQLERCIYE